MNVEEHDAIAFAHAGAVDARKRPPRAIEEAGGDMSWNDWVRHTGQTAVPQMHVGATDFRECCAQQTRALWKFGSTELTDFDWRARRRHDGGKYPV